MTQGIPEEKVNTISRNTAQADIGLNVDFSARWNGNAVQQVGLWSCTDLQLVKVVSRTKKKRSPFKHQEAISSSEKSYSEMSECTLKRKLQLDLKATPNPLFRTSKVET